MELLTKHLGINGLYLAGCITAVLLIYFIFLCRDRGRFGLLLLLLGLGAVAQYLLWFDKPVFAVCLYIVSIPVVWLLLRYSSTLFFTARTVHIPAWADILIITFLFGMAFFFKFHQLTTLPVGIHHDMATKGLDAIRIANGEIEGWPTVIRGREAMFLYMEGFMIKLFGVHKESLLAVSKLSAFFNVVFVYLLARITVNRETAVIAAFFMASSPYLNAESQQAWRIILTPLFGIIFLYFWAYGDIKKSRTGFLLSGMFLIIAFNIAPQSRQFGLTVFFFLFHKLVFDRGFYRKHWFNLIIFGLGVAVVAYFILLPWIPYYFPSMDPTKQIDRRISGFIGDPGSTVKQNLYEMSGVFNYKLIRNDRTFHREGLLFHPLVGYLFIIGFIVCILKFRNTYFFLFPAWFFVLALAGLISYPSPRRIMGIIPAVFLISGIGGFVIFKTLHDSLKKYNLLLVIPLMMMIGIPITAHNYQKTFKRFKPVPAEVRDETLAATINKYYDRYHMVPLCGFTKDAINFLTYNKTHSIEAYSVISSWNDAVPYRGEKVSKGVAYIVNPDPQGRQILDVLKTCYPDNNVVEIKENDTLYFKVFLVEQNHVADKRGLVQTVVRKGASDTLTRIAEPQTHWSQMSYPDDTDRIFYKGYLIAPSTSGYYFSLSSDCPASLFIGGTLLQGTMNRSADQAVYHAFLCKGLQPFEISLQNSSSSACNVRLSWKYDNLNDSAVPDSMFCSIDRVPEELRGSAVREMHNTVTKSSEIDIFTRDEEYPPFLPLDIAVSQNGEIFVCDVARQRVIVIGPDGKRNREWIIRENPTTKNPFLMELKDHFFIELIKDSMVAVVETSKPSCMIFDLNGELANTFKIELFPNDFTVDSMGNIYVIGANRLQKYSGTGDLLLNISTFGNDNLHFKRVTKITCDGLDNIYLLENSNNSILVFNTDLDFKESFFLADKMGATSRIGADHQGNFMIISPFRKDLHVYNIDRELCVWKINNAFRYFPAPIKDYFSWIAVRKGPVYYFASPYTKKISTFTF